MEKNTNKPSIRFAEFTDAWEQCKYGSLVGIRRGLTYSPENIRDDGIRVLRSSNINEEYFIKSDEDVFVDINCVNIPFVNNGDILITSANGSSRLVGKHAILDDLSSNSSVHGGFMLLASAKNPYFINASMSSNWYKRFIELYVSGGNGAIGNLNKNDLKNYDIYVPANNEQVKIGNLFKKLDNLITLHQRKCDQLGNIKKALLEKMFPSQNEYTPRIRFKCFTDAWEQCKLNELVRYYSSNLTASDAQEDGLYDLYDANNLIGKTNSNSIKEKYITVIKDGAGVGRIRILPQNTSFIGTMGALLPENSNIDFDFALLSRYSLSSGYSGSTIPHIYFKDYGNNDYFVPKINEQEEIGKLFKQIDNLITLHQRKCEKLKNIKKSLLEKMFA